ncbi:MAG: DUF4173 domain-containing protein [Candidatus Magasanikbacteria bacterium]|nr:DUF4173 domain-containing protein [Candidatus Magasanikbacteria bacterium]
MTNFFTEKTISKNWRLAYMGFALLIAILYDVFLWDLKLGLGFFVYVVVYLLGFVIISALSGQLRQPLAFLLLIPILILSFDVLLYNNRLVSHFVPWFVLVLCFVFSILLTLQNPNNYKFSFLKIPILTHIDLPFAKWITMYNDFFKWDVSGSKAIIKKVLTGVVIALPILVIFLSLFMGADAVFAETVEKIFDFRLPDQFVWRILRTFFITLIFSSLFYVLISKDNVMGNKINKSIKMDKTVVGTIFLLVNFLFFGFVLIQFKYLFAGSMDFVLESGYTFAEYARQGFFELAWVIGLAAILLMFFYRSASDHGFHLVIKILKVIFVLQVGVIAYSALKRMNLYQDAYGFTVLRLYVEWFIYFSMVILLFAAVSLVIENKFRTFLYSSMVLGVIALTVVSCINVDKMIANENVDRYLDEGKELDILYLTQDLSLDTYTEVRRAFESGFVFADDTYRIAVEQGEAYTTNTFNKDNFHALYNVSNMAGDSWREFNFNLNNFLINFK